jgi:hypothetical protein
MTKRQLASVAKRVATKLGMFTSKGRLLVALPLDHTLKAVILDSSSYNADIFHAELFVQPLFIPERHIVLSVGWRVGGRAETWSGHDPDLIENLTTALAGEPCRFLSRIHSPADVAAAALSLNAAQNLGVQRVVGFAFAKAGNTSRAIQELTALLNLLGNRPGWEHEMAQQTRWLINQLRDDPQAVVSQFKRWETETAQALNVNELRSEQGH